MNEFMRIKLDMLHGQGVNRQDIDQLYSLEHCDRLYRLPSHGPKRRRDYPSQGGKGVK